MSLCSWDCKSLQALQGFEIVEICFDLSPCNTLSI